jgi:hypothetical protein
MPIYPTSRWLPALLAPLLTVALLAGCDSTTSPSGSFSASVEGAITQQLAGPDAFYGTDVTFAENAPSGFALVLLRANADGDTTAIAIARPRRSSAPEPGTYDVQSFTSLINPSFNGFVAAYVSEEQSVLLGSQSGTITVDGVDGGTIDGSFRFTAEDPQSGTTAVTVDGDFEVIENAAIFDEIRSQISVL